MSKRGGNTRPFAFPPGCQFLDITITDGTSSQRPTNTKENPDKAGHVNWFRPVDDDDVQNMKWRYVVGTAVAKALGKGDGEWALRGWPRDYKMYVHLKGHIGGPRHDWYLFGCATVLKFRSPLEFIPHAIWLMTDPTLDKRNCGCKYDAGSKKQRDVNVNLVQQNILPPAASSSSSTPSRTIPRRTQERRHKRDPHGKAHHKVFASVQRAFKPVVKSREETKKHPMSRDRNSDVRAVNSRSNAKMKRWFREGELLWCALKQSIPGPVGDGDDILFWPGIVEEIRIVATTSPRPDSYPPQKAQPPLLQTSDYESAMESLLNSDNFPPWVVMQTISYKMHLLGVNYSVVNPDTMVLPYKAYVPSAELSRSIRQFPFQPFDLDPKTIRNFNPLPPTGSTTPPKFEHAAAPYSKAVVAAARLCGFWSLTDEWTFQYTIPPPVLPPPRLSTPASTSRFKVPLHHDDVFSSASDMSSEELQATAKQILGAPLPYGQPITQTRYQGLWWGSERIWADDMVRLRVGRSAIAPKGHGAFLPPSGPSANALQTFDDDSGDIVMDKVDATTRGVFMLLDGLIVVDIMTPDGQVKKECRASGMLYELADDDWVEPDLPPSDPLSQMHKPNPVLSSSARVIEPNSNDPLSNPRFGTVCTLPEPPDKYKFRPILKPGHEVVVSLSMISGRYYPGILQHPLLAAILDECLDDPGRAESCHLFSLEGLTPGYFNCIEPTRFKDDRETMLAEADGEADEELAKVAQEAEAMEDSEGEMEVDGAEQAGGPSEV